LFFGSVLGVLEGLSSIFQNLGDFYQIRRDFWDEIFVLDHGT
jgi:hypothetical protein